VNVRSFFVPIVIVVALLLGIGLGARQLMPAADTAGAKWSELSVVEGKNHFPRIRKMERLFALPPTPAGTGTDVYGFEFSHKDLSRMDLLGSGQALSQWATFDSGTKWPLELPVEFSPERFMDLGKDPGLGVREVHKQGITGKGVHVAILDQTLLGDHREYAGRIVKYTEVGQVAPEPEIHGAAVASLLAGTNVGVAPDAQITYYAIQIVKNWNAQPIERTFIYMAAAINKILDDNKNLPADQRIRVISASIGAGPDEEGYTAVNEAYRRAKREGVLVVSTDMQTRYDYQVHGLGRDPLLDPNNSGSYIPGAFWADRYYAGGGRIPGPYLFAPMDSRTTAAETGLDQYRFYRTGGLSWSVPWMAGMYALVCQVDPAVTPEQFLKTAHETGDTITVVRDGKSYQLGPIINPAKLLARFKK